MVFDIRSIPLKTISYFSLGGVGRVFFPKTYEDLSHFLKYYPCESFQVIGACSNILFREQLGNTIFICLPKNIFSYVQLTESYLACGAMTPDAHAARAASQYSITGLEFLSSIPGTIGGALATNAGAHHSCIADVLHSVLALDKKGEALTLSPEDLRLSYRSSPLAKNYIFLEARFKCNKGNQQHIKEKIKQFNKIRQKDQPQGVRTAGSTFKNPPHHKAWELIQQAQCTGSCVGKAVVSRKHCNFLINAGDATSQEIETLARCVQHAVFWTQNVKLDFEIEIIGIPPTYLTHISDFHH